VGKKGQLGARQQHLALHVGGLVGADERNHDGQQRGQR
jgi:hypothetical protein